MTPRFRQDNTEGYSDAQLAELNFRYEWALVEMDAGPETKSFCDHVAEAVQAAYDDELRAKA